MDKNKKIKFLIYILIGCVPLIIILFTFPKFKIPINNTAVFYNWDFNYKRSSIEQNDQTFFTYDFHIDLKLREDVSDFIIVLKLENQNVRFNGTSHEIKLGDLKKGRQEFDLELKLDASNYSVTNMYYKYNNQDYMEDLQNGEMFTYIIIFIVMGFVLLCFVVNAIQWAKRRTKEN